MLLFLASCVKQESSNEQPADIWNGYGKYLNLKAGEDEKTLWAGQHINAGTVTYGLRAVGDVGYFYVKYDCSGTEWMITETHMFCGSIDTMPLNKKNNPKIGHFPFAGYHNSVDSVVYMVPLNDLPPASTGFAVAAHAVVVTSSGGDETAWADGPTPFNDKDWGWYDTYTYQHTFPENRDPVKIVYSVDFNVDTLNLYRLNLTDGSTDLVYSEVVNIDGSFDGVAFDVVTGDLYVTDITTGSLYVITMDNTEPSAFSGTLVGEPTSGTFYDNSFYYVDDITNIIHRVYFNPDGTIASDVEVATIPVDMTINDIAMSPTGTDLYIIGVDPNGMVKLVVFSDPNFITLDMPTLNATVQIAVVGNDLYAVQEMADGSWASYIIDPVTGGVTDGVVDNEDPDPRRSSDLSDGVLF